MKTRQAFERELILLKEIDLDHVEEPCRSQIILQIDNLEKALDF